MNLKGILYKMCSVDGVCVSGVRHHTHSVQGKQATHTEGMCAHYRPPDRRNHTGKISKCHSAQENTVCMFVYG